MTERIGTDEALAMLAVVEDYDAGAGPEPCVHTFVNAGFGVLGAHWNLDAVKELIEVNGAELSGEMATRMGHGLVTMRPGKGPLFLETRALSEEI